MKKILSLILTFICFIGGIGFVIASDVCKVSDIGEIIQTSSIGYIWLFKSIGIALFIAFAAFLAIFVLVKKLFIKNALFSVLIAVTIICTGGFIGYSVYNTIDNYDMEYYGLEYNEDIEAIPMKEEYKAYFPYYDYVEKKSGATPYYSINSYDTADGKYVNSRLFDQSMESASTDAVTSEINVEYLASSKSNIISKFIFEKAYVLNLLDNNDSVKKGSLDKYEYSYCQNDETALFYMDLEDGVYLVEAVACDIPESELIDFAINQFKLMSAN